MVRRFSTQARPLPAIAAWLKDMGWDVVVDDSREDEDEDEDE